MHNAEAITFMFHVISSLSPKQSIYFKNQKQSRLRMPDAKLPLQQISCFFAQTCLLAQMLNAKIRMVAWRQSENKIYSFALSGEVPASACVVWK